MLHPIFGTDAEERVADVVFVHGINPLGILNRDHAFDTWGGKDKTSDFWPKWLGEDLAQAGEPVGVWLLEYDAAVLGWMGHAMPLTDRATSVLDEFYGDRIGERPIVFVAHSLGGLVVKQLLNRAATVSKDTEKAVAENTRAVIFLSTPHTGADIASFITSLGKVLRQTDAIKDLAANAAPLREQADWYLNQSIKLNIKTRSYFETRDTKGIRVVDQASANPYVAGAAAVPVDEDHSTIARIGSRNLPQYKSLLRFIEDLMRLDKSKTISGQHVTSTKTNEDYKNQMAIGLSAFQSVNAPHRPPIRASQNRKADKPNWTKIVLALISATAVVTVGFWQYGNWHKQNNSTKTTSTPISQSSSNITLDPEPMMTDKPGFTEREKGGPDGYYVTQEDVAFESKGYKYLKILVSNLSTKPFGLVGINVQVWRQAGVVEEEPLTFYLRHEVRPGSTQRLRLRLGQSKSIYDATLQGHAIYSKK